MVGEKLTIKSLPLTGSAEQWSTKAGFVQGDLQEGRTGNILENARLRFALGKEFGGELGQIVPRGMCVQSEQFFDRLDLSYW